MASGNDKKRGLGRGLSALMADVAEAEAPVQTAGGTSSYVPPLGAHSDSIRREFNGTKKNSEQS